MGTNLFGMIIDQSARQLSNHTLSASLISIRSIFRFGLSIFIVTIVTDLWQTPPNASCIFSRLDAKLSDCIKHVGFIMLNSTL